MNSKKISFAIGLVLVALWANRLTNDRVEIMFNPATDGPIRYAGQPVSQPMPPGACLTTMSNGATAIPVFTPCAVTAGVSR